MEGQYIIDLKGLISLFLSEENLKEVLLNYFSKNRDDPCNSFVFLNKEEKNYLAVLPTNNLLIILIL